MPKPWRMTTQAALGNTWTSSLTTRWTEISSSPYITITHQWALIDGEGLPFSLRVAQLAVTSWATCWRSPAWSTRTTERETSTSFISWWREERRICSAGSAWRETASITDTWCRSVEKKNKRIWCNRKKSLDSDYLFLSPSGWLCQS